MKKLTRQLSRISRVLSTADELRRSRVQPARSKAKKKKRKLRKAEKLARRKIRRLREARDPWAYLLEYHYKRCPHGDIDGKFLSYLLKAQPNCAYCGCILTDENRQLEHLTPISRGGGNFKDNVAWACAPCNADKFTQTYDEYREKIGAWS